MTKVKACKGCGIPKEFCVEQNWNSDGTITQSKNPDHRVLFYEADGIEDLLHHIADIVGVPIDHIIIEGKRKSTLHYLQGMFSGLKLMVIRTFFQRMLYETIAGRGAVLGFGHFELVGFKPRSYLEILGRNIYSLPLFSGDIAAVFNLAENMPARLEFKDVPEGKLIRILPGEEADAEITARLERVVLPRKAGEISYDRCPVCGIPLDFKSYTWDAEEGTITDKATSRRMAVLGSDGLEAVFRELEAELGEQLSQTIIEAQRRYVVETLQREEIKQDPSYLAHQIALRGMGNLVRFELGKDRLEAVVENALPPLLVTGMLQGIFELIKGGRSSVSYEHDRLGTLSLSATLL
jgi:hypothetical protein